MRDNDVFIGELRKEILAGQERRSKYVILKLGFITGIFGLSSITISSESLIPFIYLIPLVVVVFDLYILGEDYGVKRAGRFILGSPATPEEEKRWERTVHEKRDPVTAIANIFSSLIIVVAAIIILWDSQKNLSVYMIWCALSVMLVILSSVYGFYLVRLRKSLDKYLKKEGY